MSKLELALSLASQGFHILPVKANGKLPLLKDFPNQATRDAATIEQWFKGRDHNIGISTTHYGDDQALLVVDVDNKKDKCGDDTIFMLELEGQMFPVTLEIETPTGGRHMFYSVPQAVKQGVEVLGAGVDVRSRGGYVVAVGSTIDGKPYKQINGHGVMVASPQWIVDKLGVGADEKPQAHIVLDGIDTDRAEARAIKYLANAPRSVKGDSGDSTAYKVAAGLKDLGCSADQALDLMLSEHWDEGCGWSPERLKEKVDHAFRYGKEPVGAKAPEAIFDEVEETFADDDEPVDQHPADALNQEYAFIKRGSFVLQETTDEKGNFYTERLSLAEMHAWHANKTLRIGEKNVPLSKLWMTSKNRREFEAVVFAPGREVDSKRWCNLWRGFTVPPKAGDHPAVQAFKEHALKNVCGGDEKLYTWLIGFFAHMIQRPWEKPLTALVFSGKKGTGKNALLDCVGRLLGDHYMVADDDRYLLGNFNGHFENNLFFVLDEAAWAGDKKSDGKLKTLVTGTHHVIERKGAETYRVDNLSRVAISGNEKWLVPATFDERRWAVFKVGDGRRQDNDFFQTMREGMEQGGYSQLLHFLQTFDLSQVDVNRAPKTAGLNDQVLETLDPITEWWLDCLHSDQLVGTEFPADDLPKKISGNRVQPAFEAWCRKRNVRSRTATGRKFKMRLLELAPSMVFKKVRWSKQEGDLGYAYVHTGLQNLRADFDQSVVKVDWPEETGE